MGPAPLGVLLGMWIGFLLLAATLPGVPEGAAGKGAPAYEWGPAPGALPLEDRSEPPAGMVRVEAQGFGAWLRRLPTAPGHPPVRLYDGREKGRQDVHAFLVDLDVGPRDLQQCADAVIRLRAEYLWANGPREAICFRFTSGDPARWRDYAAGLRPEIQGSKVRFRPGAPPAQDHGAFRRYLDLVFTYAGTQSLVKELQPIPMEAVAPGDVLIQGGSPGHAVLILDVAEAPDGRRTVLLGQSYMPAQNFHVLRGPKGPWFPWQPGRGVVTPEWRFGAHDLYRFAAPDCPRLNPPPPS